MIFFLLNLSCWLRRPVPFFTSSPFCPISFHAQRLPPPSHLCLIRSSLSCFLMKSFPLLSSPNRSQFPRVKSPGPAICLLNNSCPTNCSGIERSCYGAGQTTFSPHINFREFQGGKCVLLFQVRERETAWPSQL